MPHLADKRWKHLSVEFMSWSRLMFAQIGEGSRIQVEPLECGLFCCSTKPHYSAILWDDQSKTLKDIGCCFRTASTVSYCAGSKSS